MGITLNKVKCKMGMPWQTKHSKTSPTNRQAQKKNDMYQMKCIDCPLQYMGRWAEHYILDNKEHIQAIWNNNGNTEYSNHKLNTGHAHGSITLALPCVNQFCSLSTL
jgi:hypothetical protein